jgi:ubiquinone/menaquinone biosynthesis C-methylase UbiE
MAAQAQAQAVWAAGDYQQIAELIWDVGAVAVDRAAIRPREDVLDVACGTGNAAIRAALAGGRVIGVDLTPELLDRGSRVARMYGVDLELREGDAEELPFADASFDVVLSTFGAMFAPDHGRTAAEIVRVLRPGGRFVLCNWTPEGTVGDFFRTLGAYLPPLPDGAAPPVAWGDEDHVTRLFDQLGARLTFGRDEVVFRFDSADSAVALYERVFGPVVTARMLAETDGRAADLRHDMVAMYERHSEPSARGIEVRAEYLVVSGSI